MRRGALAARVMLAWANMEGRMPARKPGEDVRAALAAVPDHQVGELIAGVLYVSARPSSPHAFTASHLGADVLSLFGRGRGGPGGWWILDEPELHLGDDVLVPDIAGWRRERMPFPPDVAAFELAPDWVCEVLSPSTVRMDRLAKLASYAEHGVAYVWLVDPAARVVEVYRRQGRGWAVVTVADGDDPAARLEPFEAVALDLTAWWRPEGPMMVEEAAGAYAAGG